MLMTIESSSQQSSTETPTTPRGWAACRHHFLSQEATSDQQSLDFPGAHFAPPPGLTGQDLLDIIQGRAPDAWVNEILRALLGWRQLETGEWDDTHVETKWRDAYKQGPPDFIGRDGYYEPSFDRPVKAAVTNLTRSVPPKYKPVFREVTQPLGFKGWRIHQLTPNLTRRAQAVNWIVYWFRTHYPDYVWSLDE